MEFALGANRPPVCQNDVFGDGESQPRASGFPRTSFIDPVEPLEEARQMLGGNPGSEVLDVEFDAGLRPRGLRG